MKNQMIPLGKNWVAFKEWSSPNTVVTINVRALAYTVHLLKKRQLENDTNPYTDGIARIALLEGHLKNAIQKGEPDVQITLSPAEIKMLRDAFTHRFDPNNKEIDCSTYEFLECNAVTEVKEFLHDESLPRFMNYATEEDTSDESAGTVNENPHWISLSDFILKAGIDFTPSVFVELSIDEVAQMLSELLDILDVYERLLGEGESDSQIECLQKSIAMLEVQHDYVVKTKSGDFNKIELTLWFVTERMLHVMFSRIKINLQKNDCAGNEEWYSQRLLNDYPRMVSNPIESRLMREDQSSVAFYQSFIF